MSVIGSNILAGASGQGGGYNLTRSLRFRSSASAYLNRTPASAGNRKTWTWSGWVKRGKLGATTGLFDSFYDASNFSQLQFDSSDRLYFYTCNTDSGFVDYSYETVAVFRDPSAWYHIVIVLNTPSSTQADRFIIYVNGIRQSVTNVYGALTQNFETFINSTTSQQLGKNSDAGAYLDGYLTEVNFIDGQALTPSSFGETSTTTGVWQPKRYAGTYGTNGFYLPFTDNSALTTSSNVGLGKDFSGNGNYWTTNNISITSGATYDSMTDVPTLTSATASNFAVLNPLNAEVAPTSGNLTANFTASGAYVSCQRSSIMMSSGKFYAEFNNIEWCGIASTGLKDASGNIYSASGTYLYGYTGVKAIAGSQSAYGTSFNFTTDIVGVAYDADVGTLTMYKNGVSQGALATGLSGEFAFACLGSAGRIGQANFGQRPFAFSPPTGYVALNCYNLP